MSMGKHLLALVSSSTPLLAYSSLIFHTVTFPSLLIGLSSRSTGPISHCKRVLERYVRGDISLMGALHDACIVAEAEQPRWLAWALAIEGDWQCKNHLRNS